MKTGLPLTKTVLMPLTKTILIQLGSTATTLATDSAIQKKKKKNLRIGDNINNFKQRNGGHHKNS